MRTRFRKISLLGILLSSAIVLQGCSILAWVGIVSADVALCSDVKFESFEHSWVASPEERHEAHLEQLAVAPFVGDTRVAEWWATVLSQATDRHVISPAEVRNHLSPNVLTELKQSTTDQDDMALAPQLSRDIQVDAVLFGRVMGEPPQTEYWGLKERYRQIVFLHLVSSEGRLLWKGELPFMVVKGTKEVDEDMVKRSLLTHITTHAKELGWTELGLVVGHTGS
jgi:hypothetical protein